MAKKKKKQNILQRQYHQHSKNEDFDAEKTNDREKKREKSIWIDSSRPFRIEARKEKQKSILLKIRDQKWSDVKCVERSIESNRSTTTSQTTAFESRNLIKIYYIP